MNIKYIIAGSVGVLVLGVGYWGISPLFHNIRANDALPPSQPASQGDGAQAATTNLGTSELAGAPAPVTGTPGHPASGTVRVVTSAGVQYVRYENFHTINGPDIYVYLSKDKDAKEFVSLGKVRATEGNINYEVPAGVDPKEYPYVLTWCKTFGVLFNFAKLE